MFTNVEHIGIAVRDLAASNALFASLFNTQPYKSEEVASEGVLTSFFKFNDGPGQTKIELLVPTRPDSPIATYLEKRGEGIHHLAFEVTDIVAQLPPVMNRFYSNQDLRTCTNCGTVMEPPVKKA
ncbi:MAG: methylmalonyl-CoA epimerase [Cytophagaceae bacterium]|nr:MAG: methylmalonyl-CoA epimerase [Cytophagaceae bacterium]